MDCNHDSGMTPAESRANAMLNAMRSQRDSAANALIEQVGMNAQIHAEWEERWRNIEALRSRVEELIQSRGT